MEQIIEVDGRKISFEYDATIINGLSEKAQGCLENLMSEVQIDHTDDAVVAGWCVVKMQEIIDRMNRKVDDLIAENAELQEKYDTLENGFKVVTALNESLGQKNKELFDYATERKAEAQAYKDVLDKLKEEKESGEETKEGQE